MSLIYSQIFANLSSLSRRILSSLSCFSFLNSSIISSFVFLLNWISLSFFFEFVSFKICSSSVLFTIKSLFVFLTNIKNDASSVISISHLKILKSPIIHSYIFCGSLNF